MRTPRRDVPRTHALWITILGVGGFLLFMALILSGCASSANGKRLNVAVVGCAGADLGSTRYGMAHGGVEANPIMGQSFGRQAAVKAIGAATVIGGTSVVEREHPKAAQVMRIVAASAWCAASAHNVTVGRR